MQLSHYRSPDDFDNETGSPGHEADSCPAVLLPRLVDGQRGKGAPQLLLNVVAFTVLEGRTNSSPHGTVLFPELPSIPRLIVTQPKSSLRRQTICRRGTIYSECLSPPPGIRINLMSVCGGSCFPGETQKSWRTFWHFYGTFYCRVLFLSIHSACLWPTNDERLDSSGA